METARTSTAAAAAAAVRAGSPAMRASAVRRSRVTPSSFFAVSSCAASSRRVVSRPASTTSFSAASAASAAAARAAAARGSATSDTISTSERIPAKPSSSAPTCAYVHPNMRAASSKGEYCAAASSPSTSLSDAAAPLSAPRGADSSSVGTYATRADGLSRLCAAAAAAAKSHCLTLKLTVSRGPVHSATQQLLHRSSDSDCQSGYSPLAVSCAPVRWPASPLAVRPAGTGMRPPPGSARQCQSPHSSRVSRAQP